MHRPLALACLLVAGAAQAGRPLQTEDAGLLDARACELEGAGLRLNEGGARATETALVLSCGLGWNSQIGLGLARSRQDGETSRGAEIGGKTALWRGDGDAAPAIVLAWSLGFSRQTSRDGKLDSRTLNLVASLPLDAATAHFNLGHAHELRSRISATTWGAAIEADGWDGDGLRWAPMAELFGDDRGSPWWNLGLRMTLVRDRVFVDLSYGRRFADQRPSLLTAGFKFSF